MNSAQKPARSNPEQGKPDQVPPYPREPGERLLRPAFLLAGLLLLAANMRGALTVVSPLLGEVRDDLGLSSSTSSALISLPILCFALFSPLVPRLSARWGMERTLAWGLIALIAGILLRSAPWAPGLWLGTVLLGAGISTINVLLPGLLKRDFPTRIAPLTGVYNAVQSGFAALASAVAVPLAGVPGWGWRVAFGSTVAIALIALAVFLPQVRLRQHRLSRGESLSPVQAVRAEEERRLPLWRQGTAWNVTIFMGLQSTTFYALLTWWPSIEVSAGYSPTTAGTHMALLQIASIGGNLIAGALLRRVRGWWLAGGAALGAATAFGGMLLVPHAALVWSLLFGFAAGFNIVVALSLFGARTLNHQRAAALSGMAQSIGYLIAAAVPPLLGLLHDTTGTWDAALTIMVTLALLAGLFGVLASRDRKVL